MSTGLGQKRNSGWVLCVCVYGMLFLEGKDGLEVDTNHSCFMEPLALWHPEGHEVKVSLHRVIFIIVSRTLLASRGCLSVEQSL